MQHIAHSLKYYNLLSLTYGQRSVAPAVVQRSDAVEILAVVAELTTPLFRQNIVFLMLSRIASMVEERLTSAAVLRVDERPER